MKEREEACSTLAHAAIPVIRVNRVGMNTKLLTLNQLSERTGLPAAWLKREADVGRLPCIRAGRLRMFDLVSVLNALAERQVKGGAK